MVLRIQFIWEDELGVKFKFGLMLLQGLFSCVAEAQDFTPVPMRSEYAGETTRDHNRVYYYSESTIESHRVRIQSGILIDQSNARVTSYLNQSSIYVITSDREIFLSRYSRHGQVHHSSLSAGAPTLAAGQMIVVDGVILAIDLQSGHYRHPASYYEFLAKFLSDRGVDVSKVLMGEQAVSANLHLLPGGCPSFLIPGHSPLL